MNGPVLARERGDDHGKARRFDRAQRDRWSRWSGAATPGLAACEQEGPERRARTEQSNRAELDRALRGDLVALRGSLRRGQAHLPSHARWPIECDGYAENIGQPVSIAHVLGNET